MKDANLEIISLNKSKYITTVEGLRLTQKRNT